MGFSKKTRNFVAEPVVEAMKDKIVSAYKEVLWAIDGLTATEIVEVMDRVEATVTAQLGTK
jgi:hypothetical protein